MGVFYKQLSPDERHKIARLQEAGNSIRQIAASLGRPASTVSRELKRNRSVKGIYEPVWAGGLTQARRWTGSKLERDEALFDKVFEGLNLGWSPQQVSCRLKLSGGPLQISDETVYRFLYAERRRTNESTWTSFLLRSKVRRGWKKKCPPPQAHRRDVVSVRERSSEALDRQTAGHWEGDTMLFSKYGQSLLVLHERHSRLTIAVKLKDRTAVRVADHIQAILGPLPPDLRKSIAFDNGVEFAHHYNLDLKTYFCDVHSPWQKGGVENAIGRLRRRLPRRTDLATLTDEELHYAVCLFNHTPRRCLDFKTPAEVFLQQVLHFNCGFTSPPPRGRPVGADTAVAFTPASQSPSPGSASTRKTPPKDQCPATATAPSRSES